MGNVNKGKVLSVDNDKCRVAPLEDIDQVSAKITIPEYVGEISKGDTVAYAIFSDYSGVILSKL